jgi:heme O synthase-like polyprenyltransferase
MYREDYARAGYLVLPTKCKDAFLAWLTAVPSIVLLLASFVAIKHADDRALSLSASVILGFGLLFYVSRRWFCVRRSRPRQLLKATIAYLLLEMLVLMVTKG